MHKSSCCALFKNFCIKYKKLFHCDVCNNDINNIDEISSPIFSIDNDDLNFNNINTTFEHRYSSYASGCSKCISNNIESNAYVIISNILFPKYLVIAIELEEFNPESNISKHVLKKAQEYSKNFFLKKLN